MTTVLECVEPQARPLRRSVEAREGLEVGLYLLDDPPDPSARLRRTVLRPMDQNPPPDARLILWMRADATGIVVTEVGPGLKIELIRADVRSRAVPGMRVPSGASFELSAPDMPRVPFTLLARKPLSQGTQVGVATGKKSSKVLYAADNVWWLITDSKGLIVTFGVKIIDAIKDRLMRAGIDGRVLTFASGLLLAGVVMGYVAWSRHRAATDAAERASTAEDLAETAQAAREASLETELACLEDRQSLAAQLQEKREAVALATESALQLTLSQSVALERGAPALRSRFVGSRDVAARKGVIDAVVRYVDEPLPALANCLEQKSALGSDLPEYLLVWHPDPLMVCAEDYRGVQSGTELVGPWGLSRRLVQEFGDLGDVRMGTPTGTLEALVGDRRTESRWAAFTLAEAYREIARSLLRAEPAGRPSVLPSQAHLWTLALLDGYDKMGSPAEGVLDQPVSECIEDLLYRHEAASPPAVQGQPVLPDIVDVVRGAEIVRAVPTPGCPWPDDAIRTGAQAAVKSAARLATHRLENGK